MELKINEELQKHIWPLKPQELAILEENILTEGIRDKLITWQGYIVDGHNRYKIAQKYNLTFLTEEYAFENIEDVKDWMDNNQLGRRNLTEDQWEISIGRRYNREKNQRGGDRGNQYVAKDQIDTLPTADRLADEYKVSAPTVKRYGKKAEEFERLRDEQPELADSIWAGEKSFKEIKKEERRADIEKQKEDIKSGAVSLPEGLYDIIVIDPPWNYGREYDPEGSRVANPYPEMNQEELKLIEIPSAENCIMWLWTTHAFMMDARELLKHWGFEYKATMVWDKEKIGMGSWLRMQCEFCLLGIKGKPLWYSKDIRDIIREPRREHSRKPEGFYGMIDNGFVGKKLDYFSRAERDGWSVMGNDLGRF
jgi:N6-adenosine-specific RNA methylase IME4